MKHTKPMYQIKHKFYTLLCCVLFASGIVIPTKPMTALPVVDVAATWELAQAGLTQIAILEQTILSYKLQADIIQKRLENYKYQEPEDYKEVLREMNTFENLLKSTQDNIYGFATLSVNLRRQISKLGTEIFTKETYAGLKEDILRIQNQKYNKLLDEINYVLEGAKVRKKSLERIVELRKTASDPKATEFKRQRAEVALSAETATAITMLSNQLATLIKLSVQQQLSEEDELLKNQIEDSSTRRFIYGSVRDAEKHEARRNQQ